ncbi:MAG: replicative DNA helicase [Gammaproteobacteria bacterium]
MNGIYTNEALAEQAVLGSLLLDNSTWDDVADSLNTNSFSLPFHREIFQVLQGLLGEGKNADIICVSQCLASKNKSEENYLFVQVCDIANGVFTSKCIKHYVELVKQNSIDRKMICAAQNIITSVKEKKENRLDYAQQSISEIADGIPSDITLVGDILSEVIADIDDRHTKKTEITGLSTGFSDIDKIAHGLHGGDLIVLAGRPSMGKTLLAMNIAEHVAFSVNKPVCIFTLEMSKKQLLERTISSVSKISADLLRSGKLLEPDFQKITAAIPVIKNSKLYIDDRASLRVSDIRAKCRRIKREHGLALVVIDYIGLMAGDGDNENLRVGNISRGLKLLARDLNVPVIAISQLNREVERRNNKRPMMSDLRDSGSVEQDADMIFFIYREEVYEKNSVNKGLAEIIAAKNRNGNIGTINLTFNSAYCRFDNYFGAPPISCQQSTKWKGQSFEY